ncbi:hypothetical protein N9093_02380 [bacterium]|nr:hypothetical protein [Mariniblastus sp.]MDB4468687.1 hypothetical protein [bacterium]
MKQDSNKNLIQKNWVWTTGCISILLVFIFIFILIAVFVFGLWKAQNSYLETMEEASQSVQQIIAPQSLQLPSEPTSTIPAASDQIA